MDGLVNVDTEQYGYLKAKVDEYTVKCLEKINL